MSIGIESYLLRSLPDRQKAEGLGVDAGIGSKNVKHNPGSGSIISRSHNHSVTDDKKELALVVVLESGERVEAVAQRFFSLCVTRYLADDKLVVVFWLATGTKLERCQKLEANDRDHDNGQGEENVAGELTLDRIARVNLADKEEIAQADLLASKNVGTTNECGSHEIGDILTRLALEE